MHAAEERFVSLADLLQTRVAAEAVAELPERPESFDAGVERDACRCSAAVVRDIRVFRAQLADTLDAECDRLLRDVAYAVLGRELLLAPVDLAAIVARVIAEHPGAEPVRVRVAPSDVQTLDATEIPAIVADASLAPGDAIVELTSASIDARLGIRLSTLLEPAS